MNEIRRYPLSDAIRQTLKIPEVFRFLSVHTFGPDGPFISAFVDNAAPERDVNILVFRTEVPILGSCYPYLGTFAKGENDYFVFQEQGYEEQTSEESTNE